MIPAEHDPERVKKLVARFVLKYNYWGYLFSQIRRQAVPNYQSIMGVQVEPSDGSITLCYEPTLVAGTDDENLVKIIEHEGMHLLNKHLPRCIRILANESVGRHPLEIKSRIDIFNVAADCAVNQQMGLKNPVIVNGKPWPPQLPEKYQLPPDKITEYYYWELLKKAKKVPIPTSGGFDNHDGWKNTSGISDTSTLARKVDSHIKSLVKESVKRFNKDRGTMPSHIARLIEEALGPPKVPYYQLIKKLVKGTRFAKWRRAHVRINRKRMYAFSCTPIENLPLISPFPGKARDFTFKIDVCIDTSGSMSPEEVREGLSGVKHIIEKDRYTKTRVIECDAQVHNVYECKKIRDINFKPKGGGGTVLFPALEESKKGNPDVTLFFTDGGCENINACPRRKMPKKIIWVVSGSAEMVNKTGYVINI